MTVPLYKIADDLNRITDQLEDNGGELTPELEAELAFLSDAFPQKVGRCALVIRNLEAAGEAAKQEADRLKDLASRRLRAAESLKRYVVAQMAKAEMTHVNTPLAVVRVQRNSRPTIKWLHDVRDIPADLARVTIALDGDKALAWLNEHGSLPAGFDVKTNFHLRIS